jgi:hypothetical protein
MPEPLRVARGRAVVDKRRDRRRHVVVGCVAKHSCRQSLPQPLAQDGILSFVAR